MTRWDYQQQRLGLAHTNTRDPRRRLRKEEEEEEEEEEGEDVQQQEEQEVVETRTTRVGMTRNNPQHQGETYNILRR